MIRKESRVDVVDNSGAKELLTIQILGGTRSTGNIGDTIVGTVKKANTGGVVKKKEVQKAILVGTKSGISRKDGTYVRFDKNMAVMVDEKNEMKGSRVFSPIPREVRNKNAKIVSLAPENV